VVLDGVSLVEPTGLLAVVTLDDAPYEGVLLGA
jgi:hypothetical protein